MSTDWIDDEIALIESHIGNIESMHESVSNADEDLSDLADSIWFAIKIVKYRKQNLLHIKRRFESDE
jgi:hypothetical protein